MGYVIAQRGINPGYGGWALVGGYVDMEDKDIFEAGRREFHEETGLHIKGDLRLAHCESNNVGNMLFIVATDSVLDYAEVAKATPCEENLAIGVAWQDEKVVLCFPIHQEVLDRHL
jgi:ADP-ribose pyrophosphatase YjhB (NUDIX family)